MSKSSSFLTDEEEEQVSSKYQYEDEDDNNGDGEGEGEGEGEQDLAEEEEAEEEEKDNISIASQEDFQQKRQQQKVALQTIQNRNLAQMSAKLKEKKKEEAKKKQNSQLSQEDQKPHETLKEMNPTIKSKPEITKPNGKINKFDANKCDQQQQKINLAKAPKADNKSSKEDADLRPNPASPQKSKFKPKPKPKPKPEQEGEEESNTHIIPSKERGDSKKVQKRKRPNKFNKSIEPKIEKKLKNNNKQQSLQVNLQQNGADMKASQTDRKLSHRDNEDENDDNDHDHDDDDKQQKNNIKTQNANFKRQLELEEKRKYRISSKLMYIIWKNVDYRNCDLEQFFQQLSDKCEKSNFLICSFQPNPSNSSQRLNTGSFIAMIQWITKKEVQDCNNFFDLGFDAEIECDKSKNFTPLKAIESIKSFSNDYLIRGQFKIPERKISNKKKQSSVLVNVNNGDDNNNGNKMIASNEQKQLMMIKEFSGQRGREGLNLSIEQLVCLDEKTVQNKLDIFSAYMYYKFKKIAEKNSAYRQVGLSDPMDQQQEQEVVKNLKSYQTVINDWQQNIMSTIIGKLRDAQVNDQIYCLYDNGVQFGSEAFIDFFRQRQTYRSIVFDLIDMFKARGSEGGWGKFYQQDCFYKLKPWHDIIIFNLIDHKCYQNPKALSTFKKCNPVVTIKPSNAQKHERVIQQEESELAQEDRTPPSQQQQQEQENQDLQSARGEQEEEQQEQEQEDSQTGQILNKILTDESFYFFVESLQKGILNSLAEQRSFKFEQKPFILILTNCAVKQRKNWVIKQYKEFV